MPRRKAEVTLHSVGAPSPLAPLSELNRASRGARNARTPAWLAAQSVAPPASAIGKGVYIGRGTRAGVRGQPNPENGTVSDPCGAVCGSSVSVSDLRRLQTHEAGIARLLASYIGASFAIVHHHHVGGVDAGPWGQQGPSALTTAPPRRPAAPPACRKEAGAQLKRVAGAPLPLAPRCRQQLRLGARRAGCGLLPPGRATRGTVLQRRRARCHGHGGPWCVSQCWAGRS